MKNLIGKKFGRLTVVRLSENRSHNRENIWECICQCGGKTKARTSDLQTGHIRSCGCLMIEFANKNVRKAIESDRYKGTKIGRLKAGKPSNNTSGCKGVYWNKNEGKWHARITFKNKVHSLGRYENKEDAIKARKEAEEKFFKPIIEEFNKEKERL